jgi:RNA recognition motif-containing protein
VRGREIDVFRKHAERGNKESGVDADATTASRAGSCRISYTRAGQGHDDGAIFVSNFAPDTTQEELSEVLVPFGKYQRLAMRMFLFTFLTPSRGWVGFSERDSLS